MINEDGTVQLRVGAADLGTGAKTESRQVVAEELGVRFEDIRVLAGDTDVVPYDLGAYASRTTFFLRWRDAAPAGRPWPGSSCSCWRLRS